MKFSHNEQEQRYQLEDDNGIAAILTYKKQDDIWILDHTGVPENRRGSGVGKILLQQALPDIQTKGVKIIPQCSYVSHYIEKNPEWKSLLNTPQA